MKALKYLLLLIAAIALVQTGYADQDESKHNEELNEQDWEALREYLKSRREEKLEQEKNPCTLTISGDVRTEWRHIKETLNGRNIRGGKDFLDARCLPFSRNDFDIEFNLRFDYVCKRAWAVAAIAFDNSAGVDKGDHECNRDEGGQECKDGRKANLIRKDPCGFYGSGSFDEICLKKAYWGYTVWECGDSYFDVELGRRNLYNAFDSRLQFLSQFDGLLVEYGTAWDCLATFYWKAAGFLVDERVNHFGWVTEIGFLDIADMGLDLKYSLIDWRKRGRSRCGVRDPNGFRYITSQWTAAYNFNKDVFNRRAKLYGAFLYNHGKARAALGELCDDEAGACELGKRDPRGWYIGFSLGEVVKEGDWALDIQYQWLGATAVPEEDSAGIGTGNVLKKSTTVDGYGYNNFRGWHFEALYALTDNLSVDAIFDYSKQIKKSIGCAKRSYRKIELEFIYAF